MSFKSLNLAAPITKALLEEGYNKPTSIQSQAIPVVMKGKDLMGIAQTGTGKTAAFAIPILQLLSTKETPRSEGQAAARNTHSHAKIAGTHSQYFRKSRSRLRISDQTKKIRSLIVTPTRELAIQIEESFQSYGRYLGLNHAVVYGGVNQKSQVAKLQRGVDILIATPGRLLDLMNQGYISLIEIQIFVLDEADRMLDMGFIHDIRKLIASLPRKRQSLFFSATMPPEIIKLSNTILNNPVKVEITPESPAVEAIRQGLYYVDKGSKKNLLLNILKDEGIASALIFTRTKHGANKLVDILKKKNIGAGAIHGNKSQSARQLALGAFKEVTTRVLVATDIAARGIDVDKLQYVINYEIPNIPETYVHRIGRTGRAGSNGTALSFCDESEKKYFRDIEKLIGRKVPVIEEHDLPLAEFNPPASEKHQKSLRIQGNGARQNRS